MITALERTCARFAAPISLPESDSSCGVLRGRVAGSVPHTAPTVPRSGRAARCLRESGGTGDVTTLGRFDGLVAVRAHSNTVLANGLIQGIPRAARPKLF